MSRAAETQDLRMAHALSRVLLVGLCLAVALLLVGVVLTVLQPQTSVPRETSLPDMPQALASLEPGGFFTLGLLVLLATPAARVMGMLVGYLRRRMWLFAGVALLVLAVIVASAYLGLRA